jgi:stage IV sporulation protein B
VLLFGFSVFSLIEIIKYPNQIKIFQDEKQTLNINFPLSLNANKTNKNILELLQKNQSYYVKKVCLNPVQTGSTSIEVKLLGILPIRNLQVNILPKTKVIPGGQSVGVKLNTKGVLIVGLEEIESIDGREYNPGRKAGLTIGDIILEINNIKIKDARHVTEIINKNKHKETILKIKRRNKILVAAVQPVKSKEDGQYKLGLWVRDKTAGVGTLTFYYPDSMTFGALGHAITDIDTGLLLSVDNGEIVKSKVASIQQGKKGKPGEIKGIFYEASQPIGNLEKNTHFGIYGKAYEPIKNNLYHQPIEIGYQHQIHEGKATILTTIEEDKVKEYEIFIEKINNQRNPNTKSMVIRVTDKNLLKKSGGIVQGMSGSPIIQNQKLVGAVTHVFVNEPSKGYGIFIEWMLKEADVKLYQNSQIANKYQQNKHQIAK